MSEPVTVASVTVSRVFQDGHDEVEVMWEPEAISLVEVLGMLRLAEDTVIADRMGRADD